jgi:Glycosyl hydrolases family 18.
MRLVHCLIVIMVLSFSLIFFTGKPAKAAGAWMVEWDLNNGLQEFNQHSFQRVILFAASFNHEDKLLLPQRLTKLAQGTLVDLTGPGREVFLSVVNDRFYKDGKTVLKDSDLISRLMASEASRQQHKQDLLALLAKGPFTGLEIDYEKVTMRDWPTLLAFAADLSRELSARGKKLRFILEPRQKYLQSSLPKGPKYVIMAYNLYGTHSGPGPKADPVFLEKLAGWCSHLPEKPGIALASGGFAWGSDNVLPLTEVEALSRLGSSVIKPKRDVGSKYLQLRLKEERKNVGSHSDAARLPQTEIWFADGVSLAGLAHKARSLGFSSIDLWRLGGNQPESLRRFLEAAMPK